ncbi:MAG: FAD:protein FMN transferase [Balneolaceae bacterium]|nr:FAD:protein FMN transferase [Balneolaceae bacterium]
MRKTTLFVLLTLLSCSSKTPQLVENTGNAQGSTYQIKYITTENVDYSNEFEEIFEDIDNSMSTWVPKSLISQVNETGDWVEVDEYFLEVLKRSLEIAEESNGDFDPTVGPLVQLWGFWFDEIRGQVTDEQVNNTLNLIGYNKVELDGNRVRIPENSTIDFNAIAQGYTVDVLAEFLEEKGISSYMVEVGGEIRTRGENLKNETWVIGVDKPQENIDVADRFQFILKLENAALATSGNYRKFWVDEQTGLKYSHTINPKTGYPAKNNLLSASIIAPTAMDADAYATLCMVIGLEECKNFLESKNELEGYLIYADEGGNWQEHITDGFQSFILE